MSKNKKVDLTLYHPTIVQREGLHIIHKLRPQISLFNWGRQTGKTYMIVYDAISYALNNPGSYILFVSPVFEQNDRILKQYGNQFDKRPDIRDLIFKQIRYKAQEYAFLNGSLIAFRSAESGDNLRGRTADRIYIDETAFIDEEVFNEILLPMTTRTAGQIIMSSTPNGRNWYYDLYEKGQDISNAKQIISITRTYLDLNVPAVTKVVEGFRKIMTKQQFNREVLAMFISDETLFLDVERCFEKKPPPPYDEKKSKKLYIGIDIGITSDYTVVTVMDEDYKVIEIDRFNMRKDGLSNKEYKQRLLKLYYKYFENLVAAYMEVNNQELLYEELMDDFRDTYKIMAFRTTPTNKPVIINRLIKVFEDLKITIPANKELVKELYAFKAKRNQITGKLQYTSGSSIHDDMVMSLAICTECVTEEKDSGIIEFF